MNNGPERAAAGRRYAAVVVGASAGGLRAFRLVLPHLSADYPLPVVVAQHLHPHSRGQLVEVLKGVGCLPVVEAEEKEPVLPGTIYFAPANYHLLIEQDRTFSLSVEERVNYARPSVDVLFESAADVYGNRLVGVILTGANGDGSAGLLRIEAQGGLCVVEDPATAEHAPMPRAALSLVPRAMVLPLEQVGPCLAGLAAELEGGRDNHE